MTRQIRKDCTPTDLLVLQSPSALKSKDPRSSTETLQLFKVTLR